MTETSTIQPAITMRELLEIYPGAQRALFKNYHIGGCASCGFQPEETLAEVCVRNENLPVDDVIARLQTSQDEDAKTQIAPLELSEALGKGSTRLVDIRTREEFETARIEGSVLFTQELMQEMLMKWDRAALTVFIDHLGQRSMDAAAYFAGHGFEKVRSLRGGIDAWSQEVDPELPRYHLES
jgi:rhodanese-related sulfurtransferase